MTSPKCIVINILLQFGSDNERSIIYGNTEELQQRRIPVNDLKEYVDKKTEEEMADEFSVRIH